MESVLASAGRAAETGRKYNPAEDKKTGDQSNEEERKNVIQTENCHGCNLTREF